MVMSSDTELKRKVEDELRWEPVVNAAAIGVAVKDGVLTLTGTVAYYGEKWAAERAIKRVGGVTAVAEDIKVRPPGPPSAPTRTSPRRPCRPSSGGSGCPARSR